MMLTNNKLLYAFFLSVVVCLFLSPLNSIFAVAFSMHYINIHRFGCTISIHRKCILVFKIGAKRSRTHTWTGHTHIISTILSSIQKREGQIECVRERERERMPHRCAAILHFSSISIKLCMQHGENRKPNGTTHLRCMADTQSECGRSSTHTHLE